MVCVARYTFMSSEVYIKLLVRKRKRCVLQRKLFKGGGKAKGYYKVLREVY